MNLKLLFSSQITCELYGKALIVQIHFTSSLPANRTTYPLSGGFNQGIFLCLLGTLPVPVISPVILVGAVLITGVGSPAWVALEFGERHL